MSAWHEIVVVGGERRLRGFVAGFVGARAAGDVVLIGRDIGLKTAFLSDAIGLLSGGARHALLAPAATADELESALQRTGSDVDLRVESRCVVTAAEFEFKAEAFSPEVAEAIETALRESLPPEVTVHAFKELEETDGEARGTELYSPTHDYTYRAAGTVKGPLPGVLELYRRATDNEFVKAEPITIETADLPER